MEDTVNTEEVHLEALTSTYLSSHVIIIQLTHYYYYYYCYYFSAGLRVCTKCNSLTKLVIKIIDGIVEIVVNSYTDLGREKHLEQGHEKKMYNRY